jgi:hypothetical protein
MEIVGCSNNLIHIQYTVDIEFIYQISIMPLTPTYYIVIDSYIPEYSKIIKKEEGWFMTGFSESIADIINEDAEYSLSYPYTLERIGSFYEDNFDLMMEMVKNA